MPLNTAEWRVMDLVLPFLQGELFETIGSADLEKQTAVYAALRTLEKAIKKKKAELRDQILENLHYRGEKEKEVGSAKVALKTRSSRLPEDKPFRKLLEGKEIDIEKAYDVIETLVLNPSKVEALVDLGHLSEEEVNSLKKTSEAIDVRLFGDMRKLDF